MNILPMVLLITGTLLLAAIAVVMAYVLVKSFFPAKEGRIYAKMKLNKHVGYLCTVKGYHVNDSHDAINFDSRYPGGKILPNEWKGPDNSEPIREFNESSKNIFLRLIESLFGLHWQGFFLLGARLYKYKIRVSKKFPKGGLPEGWKLSFAGDDYDLGLMELETDHVRFEESYAIPVQNLTTAGGKDKQDGVMAKASMIFDATLQADNVYTMLFKAPDYINNISSSITSAARDIAGKSDYKSLVRSQNEQGPIDGKPSVAQEVIEAVNKDVEGANPSDRKLFGVGVINLNVLDVLPADKKTQDYVDSELNIEIAKNDKEAKMEKTLGEADAIEKIGVAKNKVIAERKVHPDVEAMTKAIQFTTLKTLVLDPGKLTLTKDIDSE